MNRESMDWDLSDTGGEGQSFASQIEAARRRFWPMAIAFVAILAAAIAAAILWPPTYRSMGTILIEQQEIPLDFVRSTVSSFADERVEVISQRVMTSSNLGAILDKYNLYASDRDSDTREELLERMREHIKREMISAQIMDPRAGRATQATIAFAVGFESRSPELAARVANDLVTLYLQKNIESRNQMAAGTTQFLADGAERLRKSIADIEQRIAEFKARNYEQLPEFAQSNAQLLARASDEVQAVDGRIQALNQQVSFLEAQLANIEPRMPVVTQSGQTLMSENERLRSLREQYVGQLALYTPRHPSVATLKRELYGLEVQVGGGSAAVTLLDELEGVYGDLAAARIQGQPNPAEINRLEGRVGDLSARIKDMPVRGTSAGAAARADNPAYVSIKGQQQSAISERTSLQARRNDLVAEIAKLEQRQLGAPGVERDYAALMRELQGEQVKYAEVRQKLLDAQLSQNLESEQKGERFTLIEPPIQAQEPVRPNRPAVVGVGLVLALGGAIALMLLLEAVDTRVRGRKQLEALVGAPPIAIIPWIADDEPVHRLRFWRRFVRLPAHGLRA